MSSPPKPVRKADLVDLHVYGGTLLVGVGLGFMSPALGVAGVGVVLLFLGLWRG